MYQKHELASLIDFKPKEARERIIDAFTKANAHKGDAARLLGCSHGTLLRWIAKLDLGAQLDKLTAKAEREGWHHGRTGGRPPGTEKPEKRKAAAHVNPG